MFPLVFLPFSRVILLFSLSVSPFPILDFAEKYDTFIVRLLNFLSFCDVNTLSKRLMLSSEKKKHHCISRLFAVVYTSVKT